MAEPVQRIAVGPAAAERKPDPRASGWGAARQGMIIAAESCALTVTELASRPDDDPALKIARLAVRVLESFGGAFRDLEYGQALMESVQERAYAAGYAACKADRCRLGVIDGGG